MSHYSRRSIIIGFLPLFIILVIGIILVLNASGPLDIIALWIGAGGLLMIFFLALPFFIDSISPKFIKFTWFIFLPLVLTVPAFLLDHKIALITLVLSLITSYIFNSYQIKNNLENIKKRSMKVLLTASGMNLFVGYSIVITSGVIMKEWGMDEIYSLLILMVFPIVLAHSITFNWILVRQHKYSDYYEKIDKIISDKRSL